MSVRMTVDEQIDLLIARRNDLQLEAEGLDETSARMCWQHLGVANRHLSRLVDKSLPLSDAVKLEIEECFERCVQQMCWKRWR